MAEACPSWKLTPAMTLKPEGSVFETLSPKTLLTPRRMDLAVKWRLFRHLSGGSDKDAERVYRWHVNERVGGRIRAGLPTDMWKCTVDDYVEASRDLFSSMQRHGYDGNQPIPLDLSGELLGGAHRLACALALNTPFVTVTRTNRTVWAPPWHYAWFEEHDMPQRDLKRLRDDWGLMRW